MFEINFFKITLINMKYLYKTLLFCCLLLSSNFIVEERAFSQDDKLSAIDITDHEYILPVGMPIPLILMDMASTENGFTGQTITSMVAQDIFIGPKKVLSRSDRFLGRIEEIQQPIEGRNAILKLDFNTLLLESGLRLNVSAMVDTGQKESYWGGELTSGTKTVVIPYSVYRIGSYGRVMYYGPRAMGEHIKFLPGTRITIILKEPLNLYIY